MFTFCVRYLPFCVCVRVGGGGGGAVVFMQNLLLILFIFLC